MSNKSVPAVYRAIIDAVIASSQNDFIDDGIDDSARSELQTIWESKLAASRVADFSSDARMGPIMRIIAKEQEEQNTSESLLSLANGLTAPPLTNPHPAPEVKPPKPQPASSIEPGVKPESYHTDVNEDDELLGSDLDDEADGEVNGEEGEDPLVGDVVIALYEKVGHVKNKWKVTLKDGLISVNGKDYLFNKCTGEFVW